MLPVTRTSADWIVQVVRLDFDYFNTQLNADLFIAYDGVNNSAPEIARLSGVYCSPPGALTSTQPHMFVRFTSDAKINLNGFRVRFSSMAYGKFSL